MKKNNQNQSSEAKFSQSKLLRYSSAAATALALSNSADAAIVPIDVSGFSTISLSGTNDTEILSLDLNGDSATDVVFGGTRVETATYTTSPTTTTNYFTYGAFNINPFEGPGNPSGTLQVAAGGSVVGRANPAAANLASGSVSTAINASAGTNAWLMLTTNSAAQSGVFVAPAPGTSETGIVGFNFNIGANEHFAWLELLISADANGRPETLEVLGGAYESTPDTDLPVGVIPEPANVGLGLGLLALGATGVRSMRRRRD
jgi:hypothetical protein